MFHADLSIVIPCYNEEGNLPELIRQFDPLIDHHPIEIILVNNGSTDRSSEIFGQELRKVKHPEQFKLIFIEKNIGYGHGILTGLSQARGRILGYTHADLQFSPRNVIDAYKAFLQQENRPGHQDGKFIVKGLRAPRRESEKFISSNLDRIASTIMLAPMKDINGQPKLFSRKFYEERLRDGPTDLTLDVYLMARAAKAGYGILTVPVHFAERPSGVSSWNTTAWSKIRMISRFLKTIFVVWVKSFAWRFKG